MLNALALYGRYCATSVQAQFAYAGSTLMMTFGQFLVTAIEFLGVLALFHRFGHIQGWSLGEVAIFYGQVNITFAFADMITRGFDIFGSVYVRTGGFDRLLLRPRATALQVLGHELRLTRIGRFVQGAGVFAIGAHMAHFQMTPQAFGMIVWATLGGTALFSGLMIFQATLSFWTVESLEAVNILTYGGVAASEYPLSVYARWFRDLLTFVVPIGAVAYFPMVAALGRHDPLGYPDAFLVASPALGLVFLSVALLAWTFGVRHYASTGS